MYVEQVRATNPETGLEWVNLASDEGQSIKIGKVGLTHLLGWDSGIITAAEFSQTKLVRDFFNYRHAKMVTQSISGESRSSTSGEKPIKLAELNHNPIQYIQIDFTSIDGRLMRWHMAGDQHPSAFIQLASPDWKELPGAAHEIEEKLNANELYAAMEKFYTQISS